MPLPDQQTPKKLRNNSQLLWLLSGNTSLFFGFASTILLRSMLTWQITHDEMALAYINLVVAGCMLTTSIFSGAVIDRYERRKLMLYSQVAIFLAEIVVLIFLVRNELSYSMLLASAIVASSLFPFIMPARTAMLVEVVDRADISRVNAMMAVGMNLGRMVSPALVGFLADWAGIVYGYVFLAAMHLISLYCVLNTKSSYPPKNDKKTALLEEIKEGFVYMVRFRSLGLCILFGMIPFLVLVPLQNLMVVFVEQIWDKGGSGLGIMMASMGLGGLLGSLLMTRLKTNRIVKPMVAASLMMAVLLVFLCHSPWFWLAVFLIFLVYTGLSFSQTLVHTGVQLMTSDRLRGRITTMTMMGYGLAPMATAPLAFAAREIGPPWAMTVAASVMLVLVLVIWRCFPSFKKIDAHVNAPREPAS